MKGRGYAEATEIDGYMVEFVMQSGLLNIYIWDPRDQPCVRIIINKKSTLAELRTLEHHSYCTKYEMMKRKSGTKKMLDFAFGLAKRQGITHIQLTDTSNVPCTINGKEVHLGPMYFLKHGMTWYEKQYGFQLLPEFREEYEMLKRNRLLAFDIPFLKQATCDYFTDETTTLLLEQIGHDQVFTSGVWIKRI